jgi:hypothetical protein
MTTNTTQSAASSRRALIHLRNPLRRFASLEFTPFVYPELRRAQPHPRKPFLVTRHSLAQRRNTADEGPLTTEFLISAEFLIANGLRFRIAFSRRVRGLLITHHSFAQGRITPTKGHRISNRERIAISYLARFSCHSPLTAYHCISNRNISHFRISPNSHSANTYAFSNRNKSEYCFRFGGTAFSSLAANHRAQFTRHSQPRRQN